MNIDSCNLIWALKQRKTTWFQRMKNILSGLIGKIKK